MGMDPIFAVQLVGLSLLAPTQLTQNPPTSSAPAPVMPKPQQKSEPVAVAPVIAPEPSILEKEVIEEMPISAPAPVAAPVESVAPVVSMATVRAQWQEIIRLVDEKNHSLPFILKTSSPHSVEGNTVFIKFQYSFHRDRLIGDGKNRAIIQEAARIALKNDQIMIEGIVASEAAAAPGGAPDMVGNILQAFGGSVVES